MQDKPGEMCNCNSDWELLGERISRPAGAPPRKAVRLYDSLRPLYDSLRPLCGD